MTELCNKKCIVFARYFESPCVIDIVCISKGKGYFFPVNVSETSINAIMYTCIDFSPIFRGMGERIGNWTLGYGKFILPTSLHVTLIDIWYHLNINC